jgi:outer membrane protein
MGHVTMKNFKLLLAVLMLALTPSIFAADLKIGWINIERIFREAGPAQKATKRLETEFAHRESDIKTQNTKAQELQTKLDKDGLTMKEAERARVERDLAASRRELQRLQREFQEDLNARRNEELASIQERANKVIKEIAESEKYDLILSDAVYASPKIDLTDKVLKALSDK